jgi:hypothetical protein
MFFHSEIDRVYLINGLSRSGNHLFITWLISSFDENDNVYFLNNIYPKKDFNLYHQNKINIKRLINLRVASRDNEDQGQYINEDIRKKLASKKDTKDFLEGKIKKANVLILSIENNFVNILDIFEKKFTNTKKIYKIIVLRDVLNLFASRFEAEKKVIIEIQKKNPNFKWHTYETDLLTFGYYVNNLLSSFDKNYITYNYNKFILEQKHQRDLAQKLDIDYEKTMITESKFLTGSSFKHNEQNKNIYKYFTRWYHYKDNKLIKFFMENDELMNLMCDIFYFCLEGDVLKIKDMTIHLKNIPNHSNHISKKKNILKKKNISEKMKKIKNKVRK